MEFYRVWYENGAGPYSTLSLATSLEAIEYTERNNTEYVGAELVTLTQEEIAWQAEMLLPLVKLAMGRG